MKVVVVHQWEESQKNAAMNFINQVISMVKEGKVPKGMKLVRVDVSEDAKIAVCEWDVESMDLFMQVAKQFNVTWKATPFAPKTLYG